MVVGQYVTVTNWTQRALNCGGASALEGLADRSMGTIAVMSTDPGDPGYVDPDGDPEMMDPPGRLRPQPNQAEGADDPEETGER